MTIDHASLQSRDGARRVFAGPISSFKQYLQLEGLFNFSPRNSYTDSWTLHEFSWSYRDGKVTQLCSQLLSQSEKSLDLFETWFIFEH